MVGINFNIRIDNVDGARRKFNELNRDREHHIVDDGEYIKLEIIDDGLGMSKETRKRVFEPFFTTKEMGKGVGLGLSTVYGIVKQSGGYIWVDSELGKGSIFSLYFPKVNKPIQNNGTHEKDVIESYRGNETVLVVEDEQEVRKLVCSSLREYGYKVFCASNGVEALDFVRDNNLEIDLLLTDVIMPKMDGHELSIQLSEVCPFVKVVYMSGYTDNTIVHHGVLDPGTIFVQKPVTTSEIAKTIRVVLDNIGEGY